MLLYSFDILLARLGKLSGPALRFKYATDSNGSLESPHRYKLQVFSYLATF